MKQDIEIAAAFAVGLEVISENSACAEYVSVNLQTKENYLE